MDTNTNTNTKTNTDMEANYDKQIAKVSELEKLVVSMNEIIVSTRKELDILKMETQNSKYIIDLGRYNGSHVCIDIRNIKDIIFSHDGNFCVIDELSQGVPIFMGGIRQNHTWMEMYEGSITMNDIDMTRNFMGYIGRCKKIKTLNIHNSNTDMSQVLEFRELHTLKITVSTVRNINVLEQHESLRTLMMDSGSYRGAKEIQLSKMKFAVQHI